MYVKPFIRVVGKYLLQYLLKCALHLSSGRLKCYCNQRNVVPMWSNVVPGNLYIIWKLNEAWPLKKELKKNFITTLRLLKFLILKKGLHHFLKILTVFNSDKEHHRCLKVLIPKKDSNTIVELLKFLPLKKDSITSLRF